MDIALSCSRCRERRLNNENNFKRMQRIYNIYNSCELWQMIGNIISDGPISLRLGLQ